MIRYEPFYKRHGVFKREELTTPRTDVTTSVELPMGPVIHYVPQETRQFGPDETYWLLRNAPQQIWIDHVTTLSLEFGKPRVKPGDVNTAIRQWHRRHPKLLRVLSLPPAVSNAQSTLLVNYGPLGERYQYPKGQFTEYHRNMNLRDTLWAGLTQRLKDIPDRHHWIPLQVPDTYPTLKQIQDAEEEMDRMAISRFTAFPRIMFLDVWRWIGDKRDKSPISKIPVEDLNRVNLIFMLKDRWFVMNLGHVESFRKTMMPDASVVKEMTAEALKTAKEKASAPYDPLMMQKRFLRGMMSLVEGGLAVEMSEDALGPDVKKSQSEPDQTNLHPELRESEAIDFSNLGSSKKSDLSIPASALQDLNRDSYTAMTGSPEFDDISNRSQEDPRQSSKKQQAKSLAGEASLEVKEIVQSQELSDEQLEKDLDSLIEVAAIQQEADYQATINPNVDPMTYGILSRAEQLAKEKAISGPELKRLQKLAEAYKTIKNPYGPGLLHEAAKVTPEELVVKPAKLNVKGPVFDDSMLHSTLNVVTKQYVETTLKKDIVNMVLSAQKAGVAITDYRVTTKATVGGVSEMHSVRFNPVGGLPTTWNFKVPVIQPDGTFKSAGTEYRAKWQRRDVPIRKTGPGRVTLTSYYGKVAVNLSELQTSNYGKWLADGIAGLAIDGTNKMVTDIILSNVFYANVVGPKIYTTLSRRISSMTLNLPNGTSMNLHFDYVERQKLFSIPELEKLEANGGVVAGLCTDGRAVVIDKDNNFTAVGKGQVDNFGKLEDILKINRNKAPVEMAMVKIMGEEIPVGVVLAYYYGLGNMLRHINVEVRRVKSGDQMNLQPHEIPVRFADETLIFDSRNSEACLMLGGFRYYRETIRQTSVYAYDRKPAFLQLLDGQSRNAKYTTELDLIDELYVDPITEGMLIQMKEPTTWRGLLQRSVELLQTDYSPEEVDGSLMVYKGYERMTGTIYREMVDGVRKFRHKNRISKSGIDIKPTAVWNRFTGDASIGQVNDANPVNELRETEGVTYIGEGGRSKRSMVAKTRRYHKNDMGTISESTVDSGDVGINIYFSANPQIISTRGFAVPADPKKTGASSMVSTSAMLSPFADRDDPKRVGFIGIQHHSGIGAVGYNYMPYRTGYESALAHRTGKKFSYVATGEGEVVGIRGEVMRIKYKTGEELGVEIGRVFTKGAGHMYPNDLVATVKVGDKFTEGDVLVYNSVFFKEDVLVPRSVIYKAGVPVWVALMESTGTLEDSSVIDEETSKLMTAYETEEREILLDFRTVVHELVKVGQTVEADSILCTLEDASAKSADLYGDGALERLKLLANNAPKAKVAGVVDSVEVIYNGDIEDMSESLAKIVEDADKRLARKNRDLGSEVMDGRDGETIRVNNVPLAIDTLVIKVKITHGRAAFAGDKGTFGNQMKSVFGRVMTGENQTKSGQKLGAIFSNKSIDDRIVLSSPLMGMANALGFRITDNFVAAYRGK